MSRGGVKGFVNYYSCKNIITALSSLSGSQFPPSERTILSTVPCSVQYRDGGMEGCVDVWGGVRLRGEGGGRVRCRSEGGGRVRWGVRVREGVGWGEV